MLLLHSLFLYTQTHICTHTNVIYNKTERNKRLNVGLSLNLLFPFTLHWYVLYLRKEFSYIHPTIVGAVYACRSILELVAFFFFFGCFCFSCCCVCVCGALRLFSRYRMLFWGRPTCYTVKFILLINSHKLYRTTDGCGFGKYDFEHLLSLFIGKFETNIMHFIIIMKVSHRMTKHIDGRKEFSSSLLLLLSFFKFLTLSAVFCRYMYGYRFWFTFICMFYWICCVSEYCIYASQHIRNHVICAGGKN